MIRAIAFALSSTLSISAIAQDIDYEIEAVEVTPEREYESQIRDIFSEYNKVYLGTAKWRELIESYGNESYTIRKGDTLWDISETLFGDGFYWPKIWSFNPAISNPHDISEDDTIRFDYGNYKKPPSIELIRGADVEIPVSKYKPRPLLKEIPPTIPVNDLDKALIQKGDFAFQSRMKLHKNLLPIIRLKSFYAEAYPASSGVVREFLPGRFRGGVGDQVYVEMQSGRSGDVFSVIGRETESIESYDPTRDREVEGSVVHVMGEIQLSEVVNESENLFRATVITSLSPIKSGANLIPGTIPKINLDNRGRPVRIKAVVVGGGGDRNRKVMGTGETVFLSVGDGDGLRKGDILTIIANEKIRKESTDIEIGHRVIGRAKVVKTEQSVSTAILIESSDQVASGDLTL